MKKLSSFLEFNTSNFLKEKELVFISKTDWTDFDTKEFLGIKYKVLIKSDRTQYGLDSNRKEIVAINQGESIDVKVDKSQKEEHFEMFEPVILINPSGVVFGEFKNQLILSCDSIQREENNTQKKVVINTKEVI
ncbi:MULTISPECIES: hypothetical protein [Vagococcus]|uniref:Uncharacterized protein n=1 Tax=Vagococcus fluvialis bH819 TaxID=1255619 RepID=A0A1X6WLL3_9ENTE|nr:MULTISPECIES: hypothetical protein [Vagococcus]SLM85150.1 hypothetical protein FM121_03565 [Vagococcus fluvialis bH819]HCM88437.1 hypothetical protein [Vagococcus sp.]